MEPRDLVTEFGSMLLYACTSDCGVAEEEKEAVDCQSTQI
jgi:hypothetical protein